MSAHAVPYLRLVFPFVIGLSLGGVFDLPLPYLPQVLLLAAALAAGLAQVRMPYRLRWLFGAYVHLLLAAFGYFHIVSYHEGRQEGHFSKLGVPVRYFVGTVYDAPSRGGKVKVPLRVVQAGATPDSMWQCSGNVMLFLEPSDFSEGIRYGDRLALNATIQLTEGPKNPHAFDYKRYLHFQNIHHQAFAKAGSVAKIGEGHGWLLWRTAFHCRDRLLGILRQHFPSIDEYAVASALLLGYTDDLSDEMRTAYAETGSMHALAVSGTHIGMLYLGLMLLVGRLRLRRGVEAAVVLSAIWAFSFITGATASVLRASVMFSLYMIGKIASRQSYAWNVLPASAFLLLLYNPYLLFNAGFQLSYAAVAGMLFFYPRFYKAFPPMPRWLDEVLKVLLVGVAAQLGTLPLSLFYFNQFPVYFWLAGWVVVFVGAVFLWGGAILVLLDAVWQPLAEWLGTALYYLLLLTNKIIVFIQQIPGGVVRQVWVPAWATEILYCCLIALGAAMLTRKGKWIGVFALLMAVLGLYRCRSVTNKQLQAKVVVYSCAKGRLVDFFDGDRVYCLSDPLSAKQVAFAAQGNRITSGMRELALRPFADTTAWETPNLYVEGPFIQFFDKRIVVLDDAKWAEDGDPAPFDVDILIVCQNLPTSMAQCRERFPFKTVLFDTSNKPWRIARWREECRQNGWECHELRQQSFTLELP
jgi:competence protein ComEC